jgi:eukaryotic-like serine/threonine-protein kinase
MNTFGKYQVLDELGTGAAGVTYRARDPFRNRELALKVFHASAATNPDLKERLAAASELRHSHIAGVCDLGEVDGSIYIATELLAGDGLDRHFRERQVLPLPQKLKLIAQVSEALTYAHSKGVAHGNLKPGNIFVVGKDAKVLDFGLAGAGASPFPNYLAPEQVLGQPYDARSDVFSCAVILYELLVDTYPFQGPAGLIPRQIVHSEAAPLRSLDPRIPDELEQLLAHALKKNPQHRLETADQLASALYTIARDFQNGRPSRPAQRPSEPAPAPPPAVPEPPIESELPTAFARPTPAPATESAPIIIPAAPGPSPSPSVSYVAVHPPVPVSVPVPTPREAPVTPAPLPTTQKRKFRRARVIVYASSAVLTICIVVSLLSRQSIRASQTNHAPAAAPKISLPTGTRIQAAAPSPSASPAANDTPDPNPPAKQTALDQASLDQVKSLWESGRYGQATELVNNILAASPANAEARAWKKKIRAAQQAEAGMK